MTEESAYCRVCGKPLTDPESVKKGIGPVCESRLEKIDLTQYTSEKDEE